MRMGTPSSVRWTSTSTPPAPRSAARRIPAMLFSGTCCGQARWAMMRTGMPGDIVAPGPARARGWRSANGYGSRHGGVEGALVGVGARHVHHHGAAAVFVQHIGFEGAVIGDGVVGDGIVVDPGDFRTG